MSHSLDLEVPRNGNYFQEWQIRDADGVPIDITSDDLALDVRAISGSGGVIASAVIDKVEPINGQFTVNIAGSDFDAVSGQTQIVRLAYDLRRAIGPIAEIPARGHIILIPEVTIS